MPKTDLKKESEKHPKFHCPIQVRFADTDANGHVFFANYLTYFDVALMEYFKALGFRFERFLESGLTLYYAEALTRFKAAAVFDDTLQVNAGIEHFGNTSFKCQFVVLDKASKRIITAGHIVAVVIDLKTEKPVPVPPEFIAAVNQFEKP